MRKVDIDSIMNILNQKNGNRKEEKLRTYENADRLLQERQKVLYGFESKIYFHQENRHKKNDTLQT